MKIDLQLPEAAGWRGLLTQAQQNARCFLPETVEEYVVCLLYRMLGSAGESRQLSARFARQLLAGGDAQARNLAAVGDQCLLFSGLFPDHAIRQKIPLSYFVHVGGHAYREYAATRRGEERAIYGAMAEHFVTTLDVLLGIREANEGRPCIDGLNAFQLWSEAGSSHGWHTLRQMTSALPAGMNLVKH
ncbi:MAG TPA: hypothetical protein PJ986_20855 [Gammaproteobacteria bacterium]|nr:hypothetical protein [Gammaproteobacteria bacterium]